MKTGKELRRILIVDNDINYAVQTAKEIESIVRLKKKYNIDIQLCNTAFYVVEKIKESFGSRPPWDIVISDLYMPIPSKPIDKKTPELWAEEKTFSFQGSKWTYWCYPYTWNSNQSGTMKTGGLHIARSIIEMKKEGKDIGNLKLVLISNKLLHDDRAEISRMVKDEQDWMDYYDKSDWEEKTKDWPHQNRPSVVHWALTHAIEETKSDSWNNKITEDDDEIVMISTKMQEVFTDCKTYAKNQDIKTIFITGETGTGKSYIVRYLHQMRMKCLKKAGSLEVISCPTIPANLFESEVFGHKKGSYTGADSDKPGIIEMAGNGTIFFDEVGDLPPNVQSKLLTLLQDKKYRKVGDTKEKKCKASLIIFATNKDIRKMISEALFREDLFHRINRDSIYLPPLNERKDDIILLSEHFIEKYNKKHDRELYLSKDAKEWLKNQEWPGNVRELQNRIESVLAKKLSDEITKKDFEDRSIKSDDKLHYKSVDESLIELNPKNIVQGCISWKEIQKRTKKNYYHRASLILATDEMWENSRNDLAGMLNVNVASLNTFLSNLRMKIRKNQIETDELYNNIPEDYHIYIDSWLENNDFR